MELTCAYSGCNNVFVPKTHNQKYCSPECCKLATNAKIMERYYENKSRRAGAARKCHSCGAGLSRYNASKICASCTLSQERRDNDRLLSMIMAMNG